MKSVRVEFILTILLALLNLSNLVAEESLIIESGFVFIDGNYINSPYRIEIENSQVMINGQAVTSQIKSRLVERELIIEKPEMELGISRNTSISEINRLCDREGNLYLGRMIRYQYQQRSGAEAKEQVISNLQDLPFIRSVRPYNDPGNSIFELEDEQGESLFVMISDPEYYDSSCSEWEQMERLENIRDKLISNLRREDCLLYFGFGGRIRMPRLKAARFLPEVISSIQDDGLSIEDKKHCLEEFEVMPYNDPWSETLLSGIRVSADFHNRISELQERIRSEFGSEVLDINHRNKLAESDLRIETGDNDRGIAYSPDGVWMMFYYAHAFQRSYEDDIDSVKDPIDDQEPDRYTVMEYYDDSEDDNNVGGCTLAHWINCKNADVLAICSHGNTGIFASAYFKDIAHAEAWINLQSNMVAVVCTAFEWEDDDNGQTYYPLMVVVFNSWVYNEWHPLLTISKAIVFVNSCKGNSKLGGNSFLTSCGGGVGFGYPGICNSDVIQNNSEGLLERMNGTIGEGAYRKSGLAFNIMNRQSNWEIEGSLDITLCPGTRYFSPQDNETVGCRGWGYVEVDTYCHDNIPATEALMFSTSGSVQIDSVHWVSSGMPGKSNEIDFFWEAPPSSSFSVTVNVMHDKWRSWGFQTASYHPLDVNRIAPNTLDGEIEFNGCTTVNADFVAETQICYVGEEVPFYDLSVCNPEPVLWEWDFDFDGVIDSDEQNPVCVYDAAGVYSVSLVVGNDIDEEIILKEDYITVLENYPYIEDINTYTPYAGQLLKLSGYNFAGNAADSAVLIGGTIFQDNITYWTDDEVYINFPHLPGIETTTLQLFNGIEYSNTLELTIKIPATAYILTPAEGEIIYADTLQIIAAPEIRSNLITTALFEYRNEGGVWLAIGEDNDGSEMKYSTYAWIGEGDGWSCYWDISEIELAETDIRVTMFDIFDQELAGETSVLIDKTPIMPLLNPDISDLTASQAIENDSLVFDFELLDMEVDSVVIKGTQVGWHYERELEMIEQDSLGIKDANGNDVSNMACAPAAAAACLKWFASQYPGSSLNTMSAEDIARKLAEYAGTDSSGTSDSDLESAIRQFLENDPALNGADWVTGRHNQGDYRTRTNPDGTVDTTYVSVYEKMMKALDDSSDVVIRLKQQANNDLNGDGVIDEKDSYGHFVTLSSHGVRSWPAFFAQGFNQCVMCRQPYIDYMDPATGQRVEVPLLEDKEPVELEGYNLNPGHTTGNTTIDGIITLRPGNRMIRESRDEFVIATVDVDGAGNYRKAVSSLDLPEGVILVQLTTANAPSYEGTENFVSVVGGFYPYFSAAPLDGDCPLTVSFTDQSEPYEDDILDWHWDFGDSCISIMQNPVHTYFSSGVYTVSLTVDDGDFPVTWLFTDYITVAESEHLYGDIDYNGIVETYDASLLLQYIVGFNTAPAAPQPWEDWRIMVADVDGNGELYAYDASLILQYFVGIIDEFPIENGNNRLSPEAWVEVVFEAGNLKFYAEGDLLGFEMNIEDIADYIQQPIIDIQDCLWSYNQKTSRIAICSAEPVITGRSFITIPVIDEEKVMGRILEMTVNNKPVQIEIPEMGIPKITQVTAVYPNPFNPDLSIAYNLAEDLHVQIYFYNLKGQKIHSIDDGIQNAGQYIYTWKPVNCSSGIYFVKIILGRDEKIFKIMLLK